jgi:hypothetical protein
VNGRERSVGLEDERAAVDIVDIVDTETVDTDEAGRVAVDIVDTDGEAGRAVAVDIVDTDGAVAADEAGRTVAVDIVDTDGEAGRAVAVDIVDTDGPVAVDNETVDTGSDGAVAVVSAAGHEDIAMRLPPFAFVTLDFFMLDVVDFQMIQCAFFSVEVAHPLQRKSTR